MFEVTLCMEQIPIWKSQPSVSWSQVLDNSAYDDLLLKFGARDYNVLIGTLAKYLFVPNEALARKIEQWAAKIAPLGPAVAVQIRTRMAGDEADEFRKHDEQFLKNTLDCVQSMLELQQPNTPLIVMTIDHDVVQSVKRHFSTRSIFHVTAPDGLRLVGFRHSNISSAEVEHLLVEWFLFGLAADAVVTYGSSLAISSFLRSKPHSMPFYILPVELLPPEITAEAAQSCIRRSFAPGRACYMGTIALWGMPKVRQY